MPAPAVHLRHSIVTGLSTRALCGPVVWSWTDDVQAVTCPRCVSHMELQPA